MLKMHQNNLIFAGLFTGLTAIGAFLRIPLPVVPMTLQVFMFLLSGLLLPPRAALLSQAAYLLLGLAGVPIFAGGGGISYIVAPTFGYVAAQLPAAWATAWIAGKFRVSAASLFAASAAGIGILYFLGAFVLYLNLNLLAQTKISVYETIKIGIIPFLLPDFLKACAAVFLAVKIRRTFF